MAVDGGPGPAGSTGMAALKSFPGKGFPRPAAFPAAQLHLEDRRGRDARDLLHQHTLPPYPSTNSLPTTMPSWYSPSLHEGYPVG